VRLWRWKSSKHEQPVAEPAPPPPAPVVPQHPKTGDDLRKAFLEKLDARAEEKQA